MTGRLPTFLVIGAMKSGTSSLREHLRDHPDVWLPEADELHFFVQNGAWSRGAEWYREQFAGAGDAVAVGEKSPTYSMDPEHPGVPGRVAALIPDVRLVYLVRHPIDRIVSHWIHNVERGDESRALNEAVRSDHRYLSTSRYGHQLDIWAQEVDRAQLLVLTTDALDSNPMAVMTRVFRHLGVDDDVSPAGSSIRAHSSAGKRVPTATLTKLKRVPGAEQIIRRVPAPLRRAGGWLARRPASSLDTTIDDELRRWLVDELAPDLAALSAWLDEPVGWDLAAD